MKHFTHLILMLALLCAGCAINTVDGASGRNGKTSTVFPADEIFESTALRTVKVYRDSSARRALGSGAIVEYRGYYFVLTAFHVTLPTMNSSSREAIETGIAKLTTVIEYSDGSRTEPLFVSALPSADLLILGPVQPRPDISELPGIKFEDLSEQDTGERLLVWGAPHGYGPAPLIGINQSRVVVFPSEGSRLGVYDIPASMNTAQAVLEATNRGGWLGFRVGVGGQNGNSGGPAFDYSGRLLGIISVGATDPAYAPQMGLIGVYLREQVKFLVNGFDYQIRQMEAIKKASSP